jgi:hypothetical protein
MKGEREYGVYPHLFVHDGVHPVSIRLYEIEYSGFADALVEGYDTE